MANHNIGSIWRRWDLHVHTPASHVQNYGSDERAWERFFKDIEALPDNFIAIGINDYIFIDGYRRVLLARKAGRLRNIEVVFPVIEVRLARLAGTSKLSRVNYHIIFSNVLSPDQIESQFLSQLRGRAKLSPESELDEVDWNGFVSRESIAQLGAAIRRSVPQSELRKYTESDFELGMNNINFDQDTLTEILATGSGIAGNYITAVGKAEWDQFRWNDYSIAEKKTIINSADAVFTAAKDATSFHRARQSLIDQGVNSKLLDCSDAHNYSDSKEKDCIGNCLQWIKADPTFAGLRIALHDYKHRVYVGSEPPVLERMRIHPRAFIRSISFHRSETAKSLETWFDSQSVELNPELVAIIGNRGSGKSALLDSIAFTGRSEYPVSKTSFLSQFRRAKDGKAGDFTLQIQWIGGEPSEVCLADDQNLAASPMVKHLPQHFIDQLCNERSDEFTKELEQAIFSHVREDEKLDSYNLREVVKKRSHQIEVSVEKHTRELEQLNRAIVDLEKQEHPSHLEDIRNRISSLKEEFFALVHNRVTYPPPITDPTLEDSERLSNLKTELAKISVAFNTKTDRRKVVRKLIESTRRIRSHAELAVQRIKEIKTIIAEDLGALGIHFSDIFSLEINLTSVEEAGARLNDEQAELDSLLDEANPKSLAAKKQKLTTAVADFTKGMTEQQQHREAALQEREKLRQKVRKLVGCREDMNSIRGLEAKVEYIEQDLSRKLDELMVKRLDVSNQLFAEKKKLVAIYEELYEPVQNFVDRQGTEATLGVAFEANLLETGFAKRFFEFIARNKRGTFHGAQDGSERLSLLLKSVDFNSAESVKQFLCNLIKFLSEDKREGFKGKRRYIHDQLRTSNLVDFYDYVFGLSYLTPQYCITLDNKLLEDLSPGEKGGLLLVFYLLVDQSNMPLLIDQPEENLDNQSVYNVLSPFIRKARARRQILLVTHNPNIAVIAGADQVIYCSIDKSTGYQVGYETGSLENPDINKRIVDVLEGTMPAFKRRGKNYEIAQ